MRRLIVILFALLMVLPVAAQITNDADVPLEPFVSEPLDVQGVRPEGWVVAGEGVFQRAGDAFDLTAIIMQAQAIEKEAFLSDLPRLLQLSSDLEAMDAIESDTFTWDVYQATRELGEQELLIDLAVTEDEETGRTYYVLMQTTAFFYDNLHAGLFLPAVQALNSIQFYEDAEGTFAVPIPVLWEATTIDESYGQLTDPEQSVAVFVDAIESDDPVAASEAFLATINEAFEDTFDDDVHTLEVVEDADRIGELESVTIITWADGTTEEGFVLQTVARLYDGTVYITAIVSDVDAIVENEEDIARIDNGFTIEALETEETDNMDDSDMDDADSDGDESEDESDDS